jgi:hypothetical protein
MWTGDTDPYVNQPQPAKPVVHPDPFSSYAWKYLRIPLKLRLMTSASTR